MNDRKDLFLSEETKNEFVKENNDMLFKRYMLDGLEFTIRKVDRLPNCEKKNIKFQIKLQWALLFFLVCGIIGSRFL